MDWVRIIYWVSIAIVWVGLVVVWCLIGRNWKRGKELDKLSEEYRKAIDAFRFAQYAYEEKLAELRKEGSGEGADCDRCN